jgi:1-acyl-sn-glycerol-3-phosphate acyltransferase
MKNKKASYSRLNLFLRSLTYSVIMTITCVVYCIPCLLAAPLPLRLRYPFTNLWILGMLKLCRLICHIDYQVEGWSNTKKIKNGIIMCKHQSAWETFFMQSHFNQVAMITKKELLFFPFFGWALALLGPIAINRKKSKSAMQQLITQGQRCLDAGRWVVVFPEGTRIAYGDIGKYKLGGARLSVATGYPIIPVAHNAGRYWPRRQFIKNPGTIRIAFGEPIYPEGKTPEEVLELTQTWIENKIKEFD